MARSDREYLFLRSLEKVLNEEDFPSRIIERLYERFFGATHPPRNFELPEVANWESSVLARAVKLSAEIAAHYVRLYADPRNLPVTHYWKQKQVAIQLDAVFTSILWEAIRRSTEPGKTYDVYSETLSDDFLDKPVLFLKQETRKGAFPSVNKRPDLGAIQIRFMQRVLSSGIDLAKLEQEDFHQL